MSFNLDCYSWDRLSFNLNMKKNCNVTILTGGCRNIYMFESSPDDWGCNGKNIIFGQFLLQPSLNKRRWICETGRSLARKESAQTCWVRRRKSSYASSAPIFFKSRDLKSFLQPDFLCGLSCVAKKPSEYENILRIISRKFFFANIFLNILQHLPLLYILLWGRHQTQNPVVPIFFRFSLGPTHVPSCHASQCHWGPCNMPISI